MPQIVTALKILLILTLPLLACTGYYAAQRLDGNNLLITLAPLAAPAALLGLAGAALLLTRRPVNRNTLWICVPALLIPVLFFVYLWF